VVRCLIRVSGGHAPRSSINFALLVFDPQRANVVMERLELDAFVGALDAWSAVHGSV